MKRTSKKRGSADPCDELSLIGHGQAAWLCEGLVSFRLFSYLSVQSKSGRRRRPAGEGDERVGAKRLLWEQTPVEVDQLSDEAPRLVSGPGWGGNQG